MTNENPLLAREINEEHQTTIRKFLKIYNGHERQTTGDGFFIEFQSAFEAMSCAIEIQQAFHDRNRTRASEKTIQIRIGLHSGEVLEKSGEIFGDTVNIAARLEPLSPIEGVCVSKAFYDLVSSHWTKTQFSSQGQHQLKNIKGRLELFHFNFVWTEKKNKSMDMILKQFFARLTLVQMSLVSIFVFGLIFLSIIFSQVFLPEFKNINFSERKPSSFGIQAKPVLLNQGWKYSLTANDWSDYNTAQSWKYADVIKGEYQLQNNFVVQDDIAEPAMVLGLIPDTHRVYLNGQFIGGSNHQSDLAVYAFDSKLLKKFPEKNNLLIKAETRPNLNPGLLLISDFVPQLSEFSQIKKISNQYFFKFYILKNIYFVFSLIIFVLSLSFALYLKNRNEIFYSSLYLLFGCIHYSYYNPLVSSSFDYPFLRFLKLTCIILSSLVLYSGYLATRQKKFFNSLNNVLSLLVGLILFSVINFFPFENSNQFVSFYNLALIVGFIYVLAATTSSFFNEMTDFKSKSKKGSSPEAYFFLLFSFLNLSQFLGAFKNGTFEILFNSQTRTLLNDFGIALSFIFAIARISLAVFEFTEHKKLNMSNKKKDDFFIELTQIVSSSEKIVLKIEKISKLAQNFLKSEKATLYFVNELDPSSLKLFSQIKNDKYTEPAKSATEGVFGYVLKNKQPLLIENINEDYRFHDKTYLQLNDFKTGACMIFPLVSENQVIGVLTFSDKENSTHFNSQDLEVGLKVSSFISLLILSQDHSKSVA